MMGVCLVQKKNEVSCEELVQISPFGHEENQIRYAIFGGSARNFLGTAHNNPLTESFAYVVEMMEWFF